MSQDHDLTSATSASSLSRVVEAAKQAPGRGLPPVHLWHPEHCGDIDILIRADGVWMHEGSPIGRAELVRLFSTILRLDPDGYHLVTPVEKLKIRVEDLPFRAVAVRVDPANSSAPPIVAHALVIYDIAARA